LGRHDTYRIISIFCRIEKGVAITAIVALMETVLKGSFILW